MVASVPNKFIGTTTQPIANLDANFDALVNYLNSLGLSYAALNGSSVQTFDVDTAVDPSHAVNLAQAQAAFAALAGSSTQTFSVADGVAATDAVNFSQIPALTGIPFGPAATVTTGLEATYVAGTVYTNNSSTAEFHFLALTGTANLTINFEFYVNSVWTLIALAFYTATSNTSATLSIIVPPGMSWQVSALPSSWTVIV